MQFVITAVIALGILFGSHVLLYYTSVKFFEITSRKVRATVLGLALLLAVSFLATALLQRTVGFWLTELMQMGAALWLGLLIYLIMAMAGIWLVKGIGKLVKREPNMKVVTGLFYGLALSLMLFGVINGAFPRVREIDVTLEGLPAQWKGRTVVHLTDVHLGSIRGVGYAERVVAKVNALDPDLVVITGDLFDGMGSDLRQFVPALNELQAKHGVYFVLGNHEGYLGLVDPLTVLGETHYRVLDNEVADVDGLQLVGLSYPEYEDGVEPEPLTLEGTIDPDRASILLYHTPTDVVLPSKDRGAQQSRAYLSPPVKFDWARDHGIDLQLSGHTHAGQFFPFVALTKRIYSGYHWGLHEQDGFAIYVSSGTGTWGPPMRVGTVSEIVRFTLH